MNKLPITKLVRGAMIAVTLAVIAIVFVRNLFPTHDDMIVLNSIPSAGSTLTSRVDSSASLPNSSSVSGSNSGVDSKTSDSSGGEMSSVSAVEQPGNGKININTASVSELMALDGIGETRAKAIVEYRNTHGAFSSIDDLVLVSGIGEKTLEKNRDRITV